MNKKRHLQLVWSKPPSKSTPKIDKLDIYNLSIPLTFLLTTISFTLLTRAGHYLLSALAIVSFVVIVKILDHVYKEDEEGKKPNENR